MSLSLVFALLAQAAAISPATIEVSGKDGTTTTISQSVDPLDDRLMEGFQAIKASNPQQALSVADEVIGVEERQFASERRLINAARTLEEAIVYAGIAGGQKRSSIVLSSTWGDAYFLKGFALIDLNRSDEAKTWFDKALSLSPMNAQYLAERGEWFKQRKDWDRAFADFEAASTAAEFSPEDSKSFEKRRAWRGMAYSRVEQAKFDEARKYLNQCLKLDLTDAGCRRELDFVNQQAGKRP